MVGGVLYRTWYSRREMGISCSVLNCAGLARCGGPHFGPVGSDRSAMGRKHPAARSRNLQADQQLEDTKNHGWIAAISRLFGAVCRVIQYGFHRRVQNLLLCTCCSSQAHDGVPGNARGRRILDQGAHLPPGESSQCFCWCSSCRD